MIVMCHICGRYYNDEFRWTICPHNKLDMPSDWRDPNRNQLMPTETVNESGPQAMRTRHPAVAAILQFFSYSHLPSHLQEISRPFGELAERIADGPQNAESTVAVRKLLEAKDAAVRAVLFKA